jgi:hypothetical protein
MSNPHRFRIDVEYDEIGDVLYILIADPHDTKNIEEHAGLVLRYDVKTHAPVGATIIDYKEYWQSRHGQLVGYLSDFLHLPTQETERVLERAN